jgi:GxxExxY protein
MNRPQRLEGSELELANATSERAIGAAIEVHRALGPGLIEAIYATALSIELDERRIPYLKQVSIPAQYKGRSLGSDFADFIIEDRVILEIKSVTVVLPVFRAQLITYMRLTCKRLGIIMNFKSPLLKDGIERVIL